MGLGCSTLNVSHQLRMADLRARLGIKVEKSGVEPSDKMGLNWSDLQALTQLHSKLCPEETITGSAIRDPEIEHMNSFGASLLMADCDL